MRIHFKTLTSQIDRYISLLHLEYRRVPASILNENDLKARLHSYLSRIPRLQTAVPTRDKRVLGTAVHTELPWYDENRKLRIIPDLTILEPEHLSIRRCYSEPLIDAFLGGGCHYPRVPRLPSKEFEFAGNAITFELKFARRGIDEATARLIKKDFQKMERLFRILDERGEGRSVFSYLIVFNRLAQPPWETPLAKFLRDHGRSSRHRILYKSWRPVAKDHIGASLKFGARITFPSRHNR
jgi:hypothetical protein